GAFQRNWQTGNGATARTVREVRGKRNPDAVVRATPPWAVRATPRRRPRRRRPKSVAPPRCRLGLVSRENAPVWPNEPRSSTMTDIPLGPTTPAILRPTRPIALAWLLFASSLIAAYAVTKCCKRMPRRRVQPRFRQRL